MIKAVHLASIVLVCSACAAQKRSAPTSPVMAAPRTCAQVRGAYCIEDIGLTIEESASGKNGTRLIVYEPDWRDQPLMVDEPQGCGGQLADTVELLRMDRTGDRSDLLVRLRRDGTCDLRMTSPGKDKDPTLAGFHIGLTQIRVCMAAPCDGVVIAGEIARTVRW